MQSRLDDMIDRRIDGAKRHADGLIDRGIEDAKRLAVRCWWVGMGIGLLLGTGLGWTLATIVARHGSP